MTLTSSAVKFSLVILLASVFSGCASAPPPAAELTDSERVARAEELFVMMDLDRDGFLTKEEMSGGLRYLTRAEMPGTNDLMIGLTKKNGKPSRGRAKAKNMTEEEVQKLIEDAFKTTDTAGQQRLTKEDFKRIVIGPTGTPQDSNPWKDVL